MTECDKLSKIINKIKLMSRNDIVNHIDAIENDVNNYHTDIHIDICDIREIIKDYKSYPLYLIKFIFTIYPKTSSREALDCIINSHERRSDLIECILTAYSVKLCDIDAPDIEFDCRLLAKLRRKTTQNALRMQTPTNCADISRSLSRSLSGEGNAINNDIGDEIDDGINDGICDKYMGLKDAIKKSKMGRIDSTPPQKKRCNCMDRKHWTYLYECFVELIGDDDRFMFESYNVNHSITNLISHTDVGDYRLAIIFEKSIVIPERWRDILLFIKKTGFISSPYGDMIFAIRDAILTNDRKNVADRDIRISKFNDRVLLSTLLKRYNQYHSNMSMISDNIYITDIDGARNTDLIRDKKIDCVVSLTKQIIFRASNVKYFHIKIDDDDSVDFLSMTHEYADRVIKLIGQNKIVLVHCYKGISRSVSFVILILVKQGLDYESAYNFVKKKRPVSNPNPSFRQQLTIYADMINR